MYSFYVQDWDKQPCKEVKIFLKDYFDTPDLPVDLEKEYHSTISGSLFDHESKRYYFLNSVYENEFPSCEINYLMLSEINRYVQFPLFDSFSLSGQVDANNVDYYIKKMLILLNNSKKLDNMVIPEEKSENFIFVGADQDRFQRKIKELISLFQFAYKNKKSVYWG